MQIDYHLPKKVLPFLSGKIDDFYLAGGTALSMAYYQHRESYDLDFFTKTYSQDRIFKVIDTLAKDSSWPITLIAEQNKEGFVGVSKYEIQINQEACKIDFVEDFLPVMNSFKNFDGINVLSLEDIYLRKIYTITGSIPSRNDVGQKIVLGGRQEAKDLYDIYCLSTITMPLSDFVRKYCDNIRQEGVVRWFKTYDRLTMKTGLLDLITKTKPDYRLIENHFELEIDKLLKFMIDGE